MACKKPFVRGSIEFGCGQCLGCKIVKKKTWKNRILLEAKMHQENSFLTLTYSDDKLPKGGSLDPDDTKNWLHRFRKAIDRKLGKKVRYFLVGEYGDETQRPHYHAALFGVGCRGPIARYVQGKRCKCVVCGICESTWGNGIIGLGTLENDSAAYIAGYVQKTVKVDGKAVMGLTNEKDPLVRKWLKGRHPEFTRMSRGGKNGVGIGGDSVGYIVEALKSTHGSVIFDQTGDVPDTIMVGDKKYPIGRYLKNKVREKYGLKDRNETKNKVKKMLYPEKSLSKCFTPEDAMLKLSIKKQVEEEKIFAKAEKIGKDRYKYKDEYNKQKIRQQEVRSSITAKAKGGV
jgi:hypothetical protein